MKREDPELDLPTEDDENVGEGTPKKKAKKRKSKEERAKDRKVVFWTLLVVMLITLAFWLLPRIKDSGYDLPADSPGESEETDTKKERKNYIEYKL